jgi:MFS family permease
MALLDSTVVNVALPRIGRDLDADLAALQWTVNAYMVTLAGLILLGGALGDRYGRRKVFVVGVLWFAAASLLCGLAPNAGVLIAARALQGVGGALLTPGSLALIQATFHPDDRGRAVGLWSGFGGIGAASVTMYALTVHCSAARSARSSAAGWWTGRAGAGCSGSTCRSPCCARPSPSGTCRSRWAGSARAGSTCSVPRSARSPSRWSRTR